MGLTGLQTSPHRSNHTNETRTSRMRVGVDTADLEEYFQIDYVALSRCMCFRKHVQRESLMCAFKESTTLCEGTDRTERALDSSWCPVHLFTPLKRIRPARRSRSARLSCPPVPADDQAASESLFDSLLRSVARTKPQFRPADPRGCGIGFERPSRPHADLQQVHSHQEILRTFGQKATSLPDQARATVAPTIDRCPGSPG